MQFSCIWRKDLFVKSKVRLVPRPLVRGYIVKSGSSIPIYMHLPEHYNNIIAIAMGHLIGKGS